MSMMRIKSSTSGGWAEEGPLVVKRRKSERHQENRERRQGRLRDGVPRMEASMSVAALCFVHCMCWYPLDKLSPSASGSWPGRAHALPPWGWCSFPPLGLALLFLRSAFVWLEATWPSAPPPGSILSGLNP